MRTLDINSGKLTVPSGHLQTGMSQHPLQAKDIAAVPQEFHGCRMAQRMG